MNKGFVVLHRKITEWEWYSDTNTFRVFLHLLLTANHTPSKFRGFEVGRGQIIIGRKALAESLNLTEREVRTAIEHLKTTGELTIKTTNKFSIATLTKYGVYQDKKSKTTSQTTSQTTDKRPTNDQQTTTSKQCNNINNINNKNKGERELVGVTSQVAQNEKEIPLSESYQREEKVGSLPSGYYQKTLKALGLPSTGIISPKDHTVLIALLKDNCNFYDIEQARIKRKKNRLEWIQDTVCEMRDARLATVAKPDENGIPILPNGYMDWDNMTFEQKQFAIQRGYEK
jgi:hypothetical protein